MQNDPKQSQSISNATPVYQRRIRRAFRQSENKFRTNQAPGKIQGRGPQPPSWSFSVGLQRDRAPTRIQRSDSCGKRRNNGTDDACPPQAADRMRDVEFVPTQIPLCYSFFRPSTALSFSYEKESGVETFPASFGRALRTPCAKRLPHPPDAVIFCPPGKRNRRKRVTSSLTAFLKIKMRGK